MKKLVKQININMELLKDGTLVLTRIWHCSILWNHDFARKKI